MFFVLKISTFQTSSGLATRGTHAQKDCNIGEIVAAMIDGDATVKTFSRKNGQIWLLPANDNFAPIDGNNCEILGKVTAVMRSVR